MVLDRGGDAGGSWVATPSAVPHGVLDKPAYFGAMGSVTNAQIRLFKAQAQRLKATLKVGKEGLSPQFLAALNDALKHHELVKVKFDDFNPDFPYKLHKTILLT